MEYFSAESFGHQRRNHDVRVEDDPHETIRNTSSSV
jgi:hypothetical protein